ncbi:hypothetical protein GCM10027203_81270 [Nonomuraea fastidiosa]
MVTTPFPATGPAKRMVPGPAARTGVATGAARSMPRWPASQGLGGGAKRRRILGCPCRGQRQVRASVGGEALAGIAGRGRSVNAVMRVVKRAILMRAGWVQGLVSVYRAG